MRTRALLFSLLATLCSACDDGSGSGSGAATDTDGSTSAAATTNAGGDSTTTGGQVDTTAAPADPCEDDYHGNNGPLDSLDLLLTTSNTVAIALGDGVASSPAEQGNDELVVCPGQSDFFLFDADCDSYVSIEVRKLEGSEDPPELLLYDSTSLSTTPPAAIDASEGSFEGFFLRPLQQKVSAGTHVVEVRPLAAGKRAYTLTLRVFPTQSCP